LRESSAGEELHRQELADAVVLDLVEDAHPAPAERLDDAVALATTTPMSGSATGGPSISPESSSRCRLGGGSLRASCDTTGGTLASVGLE